MKKTKKIEKDLNISNLKIKFARLLLKLGIISGIAMTAGCASKYEEPTKIEAEIVKPEEDKIEQTTVSAESAVPSFSEEIAEEDVEIDAKYIVKHVEDLSEKYPHIAKDMILSVVFSANCSNLTNEDINVVCDVYSIDIKELNRRLYDYMDAFKNVSNVTAKAVEEGTIDQLPPEYNYENWIKVNEIVLDKEHKTLADKYEEGFKNRIYDASCDKSKTIEFDYKYLTDSVERTLYLMDRHALYGKQPMLTVYEEKFLNGSEAYLYNTSNDETNKNSFGK